MQKFFFLLIFDTQSPINRIGILTNFYVRKILSF